MILAEANVATMRFPLDDPRMAEFRNHLATVNREAERAPGFVWRLQTADGDATGVRAFDDPLVLINVSVWRSLEALVRYTYSGRHGAFYRRRAEWFEPPSGAPLVRWWIDDSDRPSADEGRVRLEQLRTLGPGPRAFSLQQAWDADGRPMPPAWRRGVLPRPPR